jgi:hypothetical protein
MSTRYGVAKANFEYLGTDLNRTISGNKLWGSEGAAARCIFSPPHPSDAQVMGKKVTDLA